MEGLSRLKRNIPGFQEAASLMLFRKKLLFITLDSQITIDFVWKSKAGQASTLSA